MKKQTIDLKQVLDSTSVTADYDGFKIEVRVLNNHNLIEHACYLYSGTEIIKKTGYITHSCHIFYPKGADSSTLKIKMFFRQVDSHLNKESKYYPVSIKANIRYVGTVNISKVLKLSNCEIIESKPGDIERYEEKGFKPRADNKFYKLDTPIKWLDDPFQDRNWMFQLHAWRMLDPYLKRSTAEDLSYVAQIINDWTFYEQRHEGIWLWYDMSAGLRALKLTYYLTKCYDLNVDHNIENIDYLIHSHFKHLSNPEELNPGNHGLFQLHGLKGLTYLVKRVNQEGYNLPDLRQYANSEMEKMILSQFGEEGVHIENSPDYHFFVHKRIKKIVNSPWWSDLSNRALSLIAKASNAKPWLVFPDDRCVPVGDSSTGVPVKNLPELKEWPHTIYDSHIGAKVGGYGVIRSIKTMPLEQSSFLFLQGSYYSHHHKHADDLSFILQERGVNILIDPGKYSYQKDRFRDYFLSTKAHNTVTVDGKNTSRSHEEAYGSAIAHAPKCEEGIWLLSGHVVHQKNQYTHNRKVIYLPSQELYIVDFIKNTSHRSSRRLDQWWHFDKDLDIDMKQSNRVQINNKESLNVWMEMESSGESITSRYFKGYETNNELIGWVSNSYLNFEPSPTIKVSTKLEKETILLTRFIFDSQINRKALISLEEGKIITNKPFLIDYFL